MNCVNAEERVIQTYKNHLIARLSSTDQSFLLILWDALITQVNIPINLLRNSRISTLLSAHAQIFGQFNCNATPLTPPGCKCVAHDMCYKNP